MKATEKHRRTRVKATEMSRKDTEEDRTPTDYRYASAEEAGHVDRRVVKQTLPDGLVWLWKVSRVASRGCITPLVSEGSRPYLLSPA
jgi:hypothetical protein